MNINYFDESWYLATYPDVANAGIDALSHYKRFGIKEGRLPCALPTLRDIRELWGAPHSIDKDTLIRLKEHIKGEGPNGAYALANTAAYYHSLGAFKKVIALIESNKKLLDSFPELIAEQGGYAVALESYIKVGDIKGAESALQTWEDAFSPIESLMARSLLEQKYGKIKRLNQIYSSKHLENLEIVTEKSALFDSLDSNNGKSQFNGLISSIFPFHKISVVVPVFNGARTVATALRSLCAQTWKNLEIIVIDDCSTDNTFGQLKALADQDARISVFRNELNKGAYFTRNRGLSLATGKFITVMDADDWAHPQKIEKQVKPLIWNRKLTATVSHWARCDDSLRFTRLRPQNGWIHRNVSSLMVHRKIALDLGGWDVVKANADTEFYYRLQAFKGAKSIKEVLPGTPLSLGRISDSSLTQQSSTHLITQYGGARKQYIDFARAWHKNTSSLSLKRDNKNAGSPFPVPSALLCNPVTEAQEDNAIEYNRWLTAFDEEWYLLANKDVDAQGIGIHEHYWQSGEVEDRAPSPLFIPSAYQYCNSNHAFQKSPTWDALSNGWNFDKPVVAEGGLQNRAGSHIVLVGHQVTSQIFGAERSLLDMLCALGNAGYRVTLILPSAKNVDYIEKCRKLAESIQFLPLPWFRKSRKTSSKIVNYLSNFYTNNDVVAVYVNTIVMHEPLIAAKQSNIPSIVHVRELPEHDPGLMKVLGETPEECRERLFENSIFFIANSKKTEGWLNAPTRTSVVYNKVSYPQSPTRIAPTETLNVCMVSSNIKKKGIDDFFEVASLCNTNNNIQFNLYGPITDEVKKAQKELNIKNVTVHGYVPDVNFAMQQNHVVLSLSWFEESFGRTVAEAMLNERVVVAYEWGAVPELIDEETGVLVEYKNVKGVANALKHLQKNSELLAIKAKKARISATERFSNEIYNLELKKALETFFINS
ncbi:glycosyltransferase [Alteromonas stellipolaris]|uniref:Glycosyltransferase n=1 Tax=Alteromonas stellipolaris TaxID=233316 RepID=A0AAW7Z5U1_9ALTE|nr:glycosyltransferase [Alteromonas stellipolaris]MDO6578832.1 glycosyltransferase [Alteromonas stellipolaris]MDP2536462.1 glycosyltransferase [Alteromonas stellipolaris]